MKEKILTFFIGALVGAIITTGVFLIINNTNQAKKQNGMNRGEFRQEMNDNFVPGEPPSGERPQSGNKRNKNNSNTNSTDSSSQNNETTEKQQNTNNI